jgi:hypothetical protein
MLLAVSPHQLTTFVVVAAADSGPPDRSHRLWLLGVVHDTAQPLLCAAEFGSCRAVRLLIGC